MQHFRDLHHTRKFNKIAVVAVRDWTYGVFLEYASGSAAAVPSAQSNLNSHLFQGTFANRVPGQPLFTVDLNCHCYDPKKTFVLNPNAWVDPSQRASWALQRLTTATTVSSAVPGKT